MAKSCDWCLRLSSACGRRLGLDQWEDQAETTLPKREPAPWVSLREPGGQGGTKPPPVRHPLRPPGLLECMLVMHQSAALCLHGVRSDRVDTNVSFGSIAAVDVTPAPRPLLSR